MAYYSHDNGLFDILNEAQKDEIHEEYTHLVRNTFALYANTDFDKEDFKRALLQGANNIIDEIEPPIKISINNAGHKNWVTEYHIV